MPAPGVARGPALTVAALVVATAALTLGAVQLPAVLAAPVALLPFAIALRSLPVTWSAGLAVVAVGATAVIATQADEHHGVAIVGSTAAVAGVLLVGARPRSPLGVAGARGETMLLELRQRLLAQADLPVLPAGWHADVVHRAAYDDSFGGDFFVSTRSTAGGIFEIALVDVSGKGLNAGTRALMLAGAFGGLLGAVEPSGFLAAANRYLERLHWDEGFATAVHVAVELETGDFLVRSAGHPPAVHFHAGSGEWEVLSAGGPALGLLDEAAYEAVPGRLLAGDALLLYTDGLVESPDRDLADGIDRLLGMAERLVTEGFERGASTLLHGVPGGGADDRACVLVWRT